jgi:hypothetical protein
MVATRELERSVALDEPLKVGQRRAGQLDIDLRRWTLFGGGVRLLTDIEQRFPKPLQTILSCILQLRFIPKFRRF